MNHPAIQLKIDPIDIIFLSYLIILHFTVARLKLFINLLMYLHIYLFL